MGLDFPWHIKYSGDMGKKKKRMGRPPLGNKAKTEMVRFHVTKSEMRIIRAEAERLGVSLGNMLMDRWRKGD